MKNRLQPITYVDRLSDGGLRELAKLLDGPLQDLFGGIHLLSFFHPNDGADGPIDHTEVAPASVTEMICAPPSARDLNRRPA